MYDHFVDIPLEITVQELLDFISRKNIPEHAVIEYAGCGSHSIEACWND